MLINKKFWISVKLEMFKNGYPNGWGFCDVSDTFRKKWLNNFFFKKLLVKHANSFLNEIGIQEDWQVDYKNCYLFHKSLVNRNSYISIRIVFINWLFKKYNIDITKSNKFWKLIEQQYLNGINEENDIFILCGHSKLFENEWWTTNVKLKIIEHANEFLSGYEDKGWYTAEGHLFLTEENHEFEKYCKVRKDFLTYMINKTNSKWKTVWNKIFNKY